jgi:hypothetical protein
MVYSEEKRKEARVFYIRGKFRNLSNLETITGISRLTLRKWRDEEKWDETSEQMDVDPRLVLDMYLRLEVKLLQEITDTELSGKIPADTTLKRQKFYRNMAKSVKDDYDIAGAVLRFAEEYIDWISSIPAFEGKEAYIGFMDKNLPVFIDYVLHGKPTA